MGSARGIITTLTTPSADKGAKNVSLSVGAPALVAAGIGGAVALIGAGVAVYATIE